LADGRPPIIAGEAGLGAPAGETTETGPPEVGAALDFGGETTLATWGEKVSVGGL
jgi:hypothetical protein